jgi:anti-sigma factor RsiW
VNTGLDHHFSQDEWENYALCKFSGEECAPLEEHLLICPACQDMLAELDEYVEVLRAGTALLDPAAVTDPRMRRRISKKTAKATTA